MLKILGIVVSLAIIAILGSALYGFIALGIVKLEKYVEEKFKND